MAKGLIVKLGEHTSEFKISRLSRDKIYGKKRSVVIDDMDQECKAALLTADGDALLVSGNTSSMMIDEDFNSINRKALRAVDADGNPVDKVPSTLGVEQALQGPIDPTRLLEHVTTAVYVLDPEEMAPELLEALERGEIYEVPFAYRSGYGTNPLFILKNEHGCFGLLGSPTNFQFCAPEDQDDGNAFEDDLMADLLDFAELF